MPDAAVDDDLIDSIGEFRRVLDRIPVDRVVDHIVAGLEDQPEMRPVPWRMGRAAVTRWNVDLILRWVTHGAPPDDHVLGELQELLRSHAAAGRPIQDGIRLYRRGARLFWEGLVACSPDRDQRILLSQADAIHQYLERYLDLVVSAFARAYADESDLPTTGGDRRARALCERLCAARPVTLEDRHGAARSGMDLGVPLCGFSAQLIGAPIRAHAALALQLRAVGALAFTDDAGVSGLAPPGFDWSALLADPRAVLACSEPTDRLGLARAVDGVRSLTEIAGRAGHRGRVQPEEFLPQLLLADSPATADLIASRVFAQLEGRQHRDLLTTLLCLTEHGFDPAVTASALPVHRNTLLYRVNRIEERTGLDLRSQQDRILVSLAVSWRQQREFTMIEGRAEKGQPTAVRPDRRH